MKRVVSRDLVELIQNDTTQTAQVTCRGPIGGKQLTALRCGGATLNPSIQTSPHVRSGDSRQQDGTQRVVCYPGYAVRQTFEVFAQHPRSEAKGAETSKVLNLARCLWRSASLPALRSGRVTGESCVAKWRGCISHHTAIHIEIAVRIWFEFIPPWRSPQYKYPISPLAAPDDSQQ